MPASSKPQDEIPTGQEFAAIRQYLAQHRPPTIEAGDWSDEITLILGDDVNGRARSEIIAALRGWMFTFPKA